MLGKKVRYRDLNARQKEIYNFQKASAIFAEYGHTTVKLSDDWEGADFIAIKFGGKEFFKVQLKGGLTFQKNYLNKDLYICFFDRNGDEIKSFYLYPHDELLEKFERFKRTVAWKRDGRYICTSLSRRIESELKPYRVE